MLTGHVWVRSEGSTADLGKLNAVVLPYLPSGLTLFFALSGFLLYRPFAAAIVEGHALPRTIPYLANRALRILPAYWAILIVTGLLLGATNTSTDSIGYLWSHPDLLLSSFGLAQDYYPAGVTAGIGPAWSLCVELVFYLSLPPLAIAAWRVAQRRSARTRGALALLPAVALAAIGLVGNIWAYVSLVNPSDYTQLWGNNWHSVLERSFLTSADLFAPGMIAAVTVSVLKRPDTLSTARHRLIGALGAALAFTLIVANQNGLGQRLFDFGIAIASALVILYVALPTDRHRGVVMRVLEHPRAFYVGTISYGIYLWHQPLTKWLAANNLTFNGRVGFVLNLALIVGISTCLASLTYRFIERPANARKRSTRPNTTAAANATSS